MGRRKTSLLEVILQIVTIVTGVLAIIKMVQAYFYRKELQEKAKDYLADELGDLEEVTSPIAVYSPTITEQNKLCKKLLVITGAGSLLLLIINLLKKND